MNVTFLEVVKKQSQLHPNLAPQDAIKLAYQATFGAEHLLSDPIGAQSYLEQEYQNATSPYPHESLAERISPDFCRVNIRVWKAKGLPALWLFRLFQLSAAMSPLCDDAFDAASVAAVFHENMDAIQSLAEKKHLPFSVQEWQEEALQYLQGGVRSVHHSASYRTQEEPSYRLISTHFLPVFPLLEQVAPLSRHASASPIIIAIDGRCGAGKTTLADALSKVLSTDIIHMDDFFLPPAKRTPERLAIAGGNVDYERFTEEILPHLTSSNAFSYRRFNCQTLRLDKEIVIAASPWRIIEGSYSHHPALGNYATIRAFVTIDAQAQIERILARNGAVWAEDFKAKWIPMEEHYFSAYEIQAKADIILS